MELRRYLIDLPDSARGIGGNSSELVEQTEGIFARPDVGDATVGETKDVDTLVGNHPAGCRHAEEWS